MDWMCPNCNFKIFARKSECSKCHYKRGSRQTDWMCPTCNFKVFGSKSECSKCHYKRDTPPPLQPTPPPPPQQPTTTTTQQNECPICLNDDHPRFVAQCGHVLCSQCLTTTRRQCPFCRQQIISTIRLFM